MPKMKKDVSKDKTKTDPRLRAALDGVIMNGIASRTRSMTKLNMYNFVKEKTDIARKQTTDENIIRAYFTIIDKVIEVEMNDPEKNDVLFPNVKLFNAFVKKNDEFEYEAKNLNMKHHFKHFEQIYKGLEFIGSNRGYEMDDVYDIDTEWYVDQYR